jgi:hypothetical protein
MRPDPNRPLNRSLIRDPLPSQGSGPYDPSLPDYAERHEVIETVLPNGMVLETIGSPLP